MVAKVTVVLVDEKRCKGCGICLAFCPRRVFSAGPRGLVRVSRPERCVGCGICDSLCPDMAITLEAHDEGREGAQAPAV